MRTRRNPDTKFTLSQRELTLGHTHINAASDVLSSKPLSTRAYLFCGGASLMRRSREANALWPCRKLTPALSRKCSKL